MTTDKKGTNTVSTHYVIAGTIIPEKTMHNILLVGGLALTIANIMKYPLCAWTYLGTIGSMAVGLYLGMNRER